MMAAIAASKDVNQVLLLEKNEKLGKKLYITGKGRCNFTNACDLGFFMENILTNPRFMYSSLKAFGPQDMMDFLKRNGCPSKIERGNRVFPLSGHASDVTKALAKCMKSRNVKLKLKTKVTSLSRLEDGRFNVEAMDESKKKIYYHADSCIVATGGLAYPSTGSDGDGYRFAREMGIGVNKCIPSLGPIITDEDVGRLSGTSLKNLSISIYEKDHKKPVFKSGVGELSFTKEGLTGPLMLKASAYLSRELNAGEKFELIVDLKPGLGLKTLDERLIRLLNAHGKESLDSVLKGILISPLREYVIEKADLSGEKKAALVLASERRRVAHIIKELKFTLVKTAGFGESIMTQGGIDLLELNPGTMEVKKIPGLYFVGEILDVDALTGGFNLQIAFSSGYAAGRSI